MDWRMLFLLPDIYIIYAAFIFRPYISDFPIYRLQIFGRGDNCPLPKILWKRPYRLLVAHKYLNPRYYLGLITEHHFKDFFVKIKTSKHFNDQK